MSRQVRRRVDRWPGRWPSRWPDRSALVLILLFAVLLVLVVTGATQALDLAALERLRPRDVWGPEQVRWAPWMGRLQPSHMYLLLAAASVAVSWWRRSWWPLLFSLVLAGASAVVTVAAKVATHRADPHGLVTETGGAYPSGHTVALLVCLGGCLLVVTPRVRWWHWAPVAAAACLLGTALLVSGAHWVTDVLGGALLATAALTLATRGSLRERAHRNRRAPSARPAVGPVEAPGDAPSVPDGTEV